ncbi:MAG: 2-succinyl-5-enolpyruvyl-6-hydroxy-3-cyclohexene-1-carboxylic-acid synthase [Propionibacteriaceae bacterium]|nr:2-succinyl-5-enolpyruvyl-6-hydroxy-3-cyclohexene-1-carboxylic-acid synthase [Propionibacteriaceae bacterium]
MSSIELGSTIIDALISMGMRDVVLAPGSRSAALALAADRADRAGVLRLHVRIDERVAAFTALGLAKASGTPVAVITTSGTAVANLAPAAMEAKASGVPLIFLTADRPAHFVGTGASQTADQVGVFGPSVLGVIRLNSDSGRPAAWAAGVHRAVVLAAGYRTRQPGPVQLNVEFAAPMVAELPPPAEWPLLVSPSQPGSVYRADKPLRTVVLVGDATPEEGAAARRLAESVGAPLLAEPTSNARGGGCAIAGYRNLLDGIGKEIERVVVFGHPTLTRPVATLIKRSDIELIAVSPRAAWHDPGHRAVVVADSVEFPEQDESWLARWRAADAADVGEGFTQRHVAHAVLSALDAGADLVIGSSSIIRAADVIPVSDNAPLVYANRGVAGIDGTVATATGIALADARPTTVLVGDLTLQHDLGALVRPTLEPWPGLRVVVADDDGGSIFHTLEQGAPEYAGSFERVFGTPQGLDLVAVATSMGWHAVRVADQASLEAALASDADFIVAAVRRPEL